MKIIPSKMRRNIIAEDTFWEMLKENYLIPLGVGIKRKYSISDVIVLLKGGSV